MTLFQTVSMGEKVDFGPITDWDWYFYGGMAKARDNVAIAAWFRDDNAYDEPIGMYVRAVRWNEDLVPELGPLTIVYDQDPYGNLWVLDVHSGPEGEVWATLVTDNDYGDCALARITVDDDLNVTAKILPAKDCHGWNSIGSAWPEADRWLVFLEDDSGHGRFQLYDATTMQLLGDTLLQGMPWPEYMAFNPRNQKLLVIGENDTYNSEKQAWDRLTMAYVMDVTTSSISAPYLADSWSVPDGMDWARMEACGDGWVIHFQPGNDSHRNVESPGLVFFMDAALNVGEPVTIDPTWGHYGYWDGSHGEVGGVSVDEAYGVVLASAQRRRPYDYPDSLVCSMVDVTTKRFTDVVLPDSVTDYVYNALHTNVVAVVGPGRYISFAIGSLGNTYTNGDNYNAVIWLWGALAAIDGDPLDDRRAFL